MCNLEQFLVFFPWNERVALVMNIIGHESQWFPLIPSIINIANWSADRASYLHREAPSMNFTGYKSLCLQTRDSPSLFSTDLIPRHQYWLPGVIRLCDVINPHLISSPRKILYLSLHILLASIPLGCHIFALDWHHQGNWQSFLTSLMPSQYCPHFFQADRDNVYLKNDSHFSTQMDNKCCLQAVC